MSNSSCLYSMAVQVKEVIPFDQKTRGVLGEGEQCMNARIHHSHREPRGGEAT